MLPPRRETDTGVRGERQVNGQDERWRKVEDSSRPKYVLCRCVMCSQEQKHTISCLSSASHSQLITCQEISGITTDNHRARLRIIPLLKVSDCTEIITHEIDSGISLKDLGMSGGFVQRNGFFKAKGEGKDKRMKRDE